MKNMFEILFFCIIFVLAQYVHIFAYDLKVLYFERPPYYYTTKNGPKGIIMDRVVKVFNESKLNIKYELTTSNRIIEQFLHNGTKLCSPGWFKTNERIRFAKFSKPIFQSLPMVLLTTRKNKNVIPYNSLQDVFKDKSLAWGKIKNFSYGNFVDFLANKLEPNVISIDGSQKDLITMLKYGRFSYMLISPVEVDYLIKRSGYKLDNFVTIKLNDIPMGNKRYLMFSKDVSNELIEKINKIIVKYYNIDN